MAGKYGSNAFALFLVDGFNMLAAKVKNSSHKIEPLLERSDGLGDEWERHAPNGMARGSLTQEGAFFDTVAAGMHATLKAMAQVSRLVVVGFQRNAIGEHFTGFQGAFVAEYEVLGTVPGLTKANAAYGISGEVEEGVILQHLEQKNVDWNTETLGASVDYTTDPTQRVIAITSNTQANPTVVTTPVPHGLTTGDKILISGVVGSNPTINGERTVTVLTATTFSVPVDTSAGAGGNGGQFVRANSSNGGRGYLQVTELTGLDGVIHKIRHSPDDITYTDLITFSNVVAAPAKERIAVAGVVDRHLCVDGNVTGVGTVTPFVGFARG